MATSKQDKLEHIKEQLDDALKELKAGADPYTTQLGTTGYVTYGGYLQEKENNAKLAGSKKYVTYRNVLLNTGIVSAGVLFYTNLVAKASWKVDPVDSSDRAKKAAEIVQNSMDNLETPWNRVMKQASLYRLFGFSIHEWNARRHKSGEYRIIDIQRRPQSTVERWEKSGNQITAVIQRDPESWKLIRLPRKKIIYICDDTLDASPEGVGVMRMIYEPCTRLERYETLENFGFETDLRGIPLIEAPLSELAHEQAEGNISQAQVDTILAPLREFLRSHYTNPQLGMLLDSEPYRARDEQQMPSATPKYKLHLLQGQAQGHQDVARAITRLNMEIARILGTEHMLLGSGDGSHALSKDKTDSFITTIDSALSNIGQVFRSDFARRITVLNGIEPELTPILRAEQVRFREVEQITSAIKDIADAGGTVMPDDPVINDIRDLLGVSRVPEDLMRQAADMKIEVHDATISGGANATKPESTNDGRGNKAPKPKKPTDKKPTTKSRAKK